MSSAVDFNEYLIVKDGEICKVLMCDERVLRAVPLAKGSNAWLNGHFGGCWILEHPLPVAEKGVSAEGQASPVGRIEALERRLAQLEEFVRIAKAGIQYLPHTRTGRKIAEWSKAWVARESALL